MEAPRAAVHGRRRRNRPTAVTPILSTSLPDLVATPSVAPSFQYENIVVEYSLPSNLRNSNVHPKDFPSKEVMEELLSAIWTTCPSAQIWSSIKKDVFISDMTEIPPTDDAMKAFFYTVPHGTPRLLGASLHFSLVSEGLSVIQHAPDIMAYCRRELAYISLYPFASFDTRIIGCLFGKVPEHIHRDILMDNMASALEHVTIYDEEGKPLPKEKPVPIFNLTPKNETQVDPSTGLRYSTKVLAVCCETVHADYLLQLMHAFMQNDDSNIFGNFIAAKCKKLDPKNYCQNINLQNALTRDLRVMKLSGIPKEIMHMVIASESDKSAAMYLREQHVTRAPTREEPNPMPFQYIYGVEETNKTCVNGLWYVVYHRKFFQKTKAAIVKVAIMMMKLPEYEHWQNKPHFKEGVWRDHFLIPFPSKQLEEFAKKLAERFQHVELDQRYWHYPRKRNRRRKPLITDWIRFDDPPP